MPGYRAHAHDEHLSIYQALRDGDLDELIRLNQRHVLGAAEQLAAQIQP